MIFSTSSYFPYFVAGLFTYYSISSLLHYISEDNLATKILKYSPSTEDKEVQESSKLMLQWVNENSSLYKAKDFNAKKLYEEVRIFCWIMTMNSTHESKARYIKATWAKRCNQYIFISDFNDPSLPSIDSNVPTGRNFLWAKTKYAFKYIYERHLNDFDYFLKADDDTFVIVENLRYIVKSLNSSEPFYMGRRFKPYVKQGYMSGGAGYLLSRAAVKKLVENGFNDRNKCINNVVAEDVNMGLCLEEVGVRVQDSLDHDNKESFHPLSPLSMIFNLFFSQPNWMLKYNYYKLKYGLECCSDYSVTFHYMSGKEMYMLDYLIYHLRPYGITHGNNDFIGALKRYKLQIFNDIPSH